MPATFRLNLLTDGDAPIKPAHLHAVISSCFDNAPGAHQHKSKPYAIGAVRIDRPHVAVDVSILTDDLAGTFVEWITGVVESGLRLGHNHLSLAPEGVGIVAMEAFDEMVELAQPAKHWKFHFVSPTTFRMGNATQPMPVAGSVFGGLRSRFNQFSPFPPLQVDFEEVNLTADQFDIRTLPNIEVRSRPVKAFVGDVRYSCFTKDDHSARALDVFARFATFAGVGAYTPFGMGCVNVTRRSQS